MQEYTFAGTCNVMMTSVTTMQFVNEMMSTVKAINYQLV